MFDAADLNGDGQIDFNEFVLMRARALGKRERRSAASLWQAAAAARGLERDDDDAKEETEEGDDEATPTTLAQLVYRPKWIEEARRRQRAAEEAAGEAKEERLHQLRQLVSEHDGMDELGEDELEMLQVLVPPPSPVDASTRPPAGA